MRNQQIKKVNRIFFSGQDEEKRKWIEQMAAEGWQLISGSSFMYSFQKVSSENEEIQPSYRSILGLDLQKSMPLFQESRQDWVAQLSEREVDLNTPVLTSLPKSRTPKSDQTPKFRQYLLGSLAFFLFLIALLTKITLISHGDFIALFRWQLFTLLIFMGFGLVLGVAQLLKSFIKVLALQCKSKK